MIDIPRYRQLFLDHWFELSDGEIVEIVNNMDTIGNLFFSQYTSNPYQYGKTYMNKDGSNIL